jgi:hypothetical protein
LNSLIRASRYTPCPVCNGSKSCSHDPSTNNYFCINAFGDCNGFRFIKEVGAFALFREDAEAVETTKTHKTNTTKSIYQLSKERGLVARPASKIGFLFNEFLASLKLDNNHKLDLLARGFSEEQIVKYQFKSIQTGDPILEGFETIPGVFNNCWIGASGFLVPAFTTTGAILGFQVRTGDEARKYLWTTSAFKGGSSSKILAAEEAELPLTLLLGDRRTRQPLYLCEGLLKPMLAHTLHNINVVGASGGNFSSSLKQLTGYIRKMQPSEVILLADSASCVNPHVIQTMHKTNQTILDLTGNDLLVMDWGQLNGKVNKDVDELDNLDFKLATAVSFKHVLMTLPSSLLEDELLSEVKQVLTSADTFGFDHNLISNRISYKFKANDPELLTPKNNGRNSGIRYNAKDHQLLINKAYELGYKYVLDVSPAGSSKTYQAGLFDINKMPKDSQAEKVWYFSKQHRAPTTSTVEDNYVEHPTKNTKLFPHPHKVTPNGNAILMREAQDKVSLPVAGNCIKADEQQLHYRLNTGISMCKTCPFRKECAEGEESGAYGYLFQAANILENRQIRANFNGINHAVVVSPEDLAFVDEYTQTLDFAVSQEITNADVKSRFGGIAHIIGEANVDALAPLFRILSGSTELPRYGMSLSDYFEQYGKNPAFGTYLEDVLKWELDSNKYNAKNGWKPEPVFWSVLLRALTGGHTDTSLTIQKGSITLYQKNHSVLERLAAFHTVVFMDATSNQDQLAMYLGVEPQEILVISQQGKQLDHVTIKQCVSLDGLGANRTDLQQEKTALVRAALTTKYGDELGIIDYKKYSQPGDLLHFVDGRGSNEFESKKAICIFGIANTNVNAARASYEAINQRLVNRYDSEAEKAFSHYYESLRQAETEQEIGRLRAVRRPGEYKLELVRGFDICEGISNNKDKIIQAILSQKDIFLTANMSVRKFAELSRVGRGVLSGIIQREYKNTGGWEGLKNDLLALVIQEPLVLLSAINSAKENTRRSICNFRDCCELMRYYASAASQVVTINRDDYYSSAPILIFDVELPF